MLSDFIQGASPILLLEHWKPVVGFEGHYEVSNTGRIYSVKNQKAMRPWGQNGYFQTGICLKGVVYRKYIHELVAGAFIGTRPLGLDINHKDGYKRNNRPTNLEYVTRAENIRHAERTGLIKMNRFKRGRIAHNRKLTPEGVIRVRASAGGKALVDLARELNIHWATAYKIRKHLIYITAI